MAFYDEMVYDEDLRCVRISRRRLGNNDEDLAKIKAGLNERIKRMPTRTQNKRSKVTKIGKLACNRSKRANNRSRLATKSRTSMSEKATCHGCNKTINKDKFSPNQLELRSRAKCEKCVSKLQKKKERRELKKKQRAEHVQTLAKTNEVAPSPNPVCSQTRSQDSPSEPEETSVTPSQAVLQVALLKTAIIMPETLTTSNSNQRQDRP